MFSQLDKTILSRKLLASDVDYFEAAAENTRCLGGVLSVIPGFPDLALASVLHSVGEIDDIGNWTQQLETVFADCGSNWLRFYLQNVSNTQRKYLLSRGYRTQLELGFATELKQSPMDDMILVSCDSETDWQHYKRLSLSTDQGPDGFAMVGDHYVRVSRMKIDAGYMTPYLAVSQGKVLGFVNLSLQGDFARCKNLLVHPDCRGQGVGGRIVSSAMRLAVEQGAQYFGCYAIEGEPSVVLYSGLGMVEVTKQYEWSRYLGCS